MACVDIYQALTEGRPYKEGFPHEKAIAIMREMAEKNFIEKGVRFIAVNDDIDTEITEDMAV